MDSLTFIHISDTHIGEQPGYTHRGFQPYERLKRLVADIQRLPCIPDFIVHTGDVCGDKDHHATPKHYELAKPLLESLPGPVYYLVGNHDCKESLYSTLQSGPYSTIYETETELAYEFNIRGFSCISLHSSITSERAGKVCVQQLEILEQYLLSCSNQCCIFLHHPPISLGSPWMDQHMLLADGIKLCSLLERFRDRILGVFFGHIHQGIHFSRGGISYFSSTGTIFQFSTSQVDTQPVLEQQSHIGYSVIRVRDGQVQVNTRIVPDSQLTVSTI